jgi:NADPH:quinone reductase-like Zn-dependent oxidoreductase
LGRAGYRSCSIADSAAGATTVFARMNQAYLLRLVELVETGSLTVEVSATYSLEDAAIAQLALRDGGKKPGKIVLDVD